MSRIIFGFQMVLAGLVAGLIMLLIGALGALLASLIILAFKWFSDLIFEYFGPTLGWAISITLIVSILCVVLIALRELFQKPESWRRIETIQYVDQATADMTREGEILTSKDGHYAHVLLRMPIEEWREHPFHVVTHDEALPWEVRRDENGGPFHIFFEYKNKCVTTIPLDFRNTSCALTIFFRLKGLNYVNLFIWKSLHGIFKEAKIPYATPLITSTCVFFISFFMKGIEDEWRKYCMEQVFPFIQIFRKSGTTISEPPQGLIFSHINIVLKNETNSICASLYKQFKNESAESAASKIHILVNQFSDWDIEKECQLKEPLD